jgi:photosystem II stability/assembly factor-like uncharacterized protein
MATIAVGTKFAACERQRHWRRAAQGHRVGSRVARKSLMRWRRLGAAVFAASLIGLAATTTVASASSGLSNLLPGQFASIPTSELPGAPAVYDDATCPSSENCYAVGSASGEGIVTRTTDAGLTWTTASVSGSGQLDAISCPTAETCYVGGSLSASGAADPQLFATQDRGSSWTADSVPSGAVISSIGCGSASTCMAVGSADATLQSSVIATHDGGTSWVSETPPAAGLTAVRCVDVSHCWAAGPGAWFTANQGATWQDMSPPQPGPSPSPPPGGGFGIGNAGYSETIDIEFTSPTDGWVVGGDQCGGEGATQCPGIAYHTTDGGATWNVSAASQKLPFGWQIACQKQDCLMVDQKFASSEIVDTVNDGNSWSKMQDLPTLINALACTPGRTLCVAAGGNQSRPALLTLGAKPPSKTTGPAHTLPLVGQFDLTVHYTSYQGGTPAAGAPPVGHSGSNVVDFVYSCPPGQPCGVRMVYPDGPSSGGLLAPGDLFGPPSTVPLKHSGDHYYLNFESFLVPPLAPPSSSNGAGKAGRTVQLPDTRAKVTSVESCSGILLGESDLSLDVTGFTTKNGEQVAHSVTGTERWPAVRHCSGNAFDHWIYANLTINGVPKGTAPLTVNSISSALLTPAEAFGSPAADALAALITILTVIFITFPAQLFNYTLKENYEELRKWWEGPLRRLHRLRGHPEHVSEKRRDQITFGLVVLVGAVLDGFLDPKFGFSASSALTLASMILALLVSIATPNLAAFYYRKLRHRPTTFRLHALPAGLTVAIVSVLISRATSFEPGYLYGLVCGVAFATQLAVHEDGHVAGISSLCSMSVAVVAWLIWVPVHTAAALPGTAAWQVLLTDLLAAVFVGGLVGNVVGLLPLNFMQGGTLAKWHKGAWAAVYGVTTFGFIQTMLQPESAVANRGSAPAITALILFALFGGASIAFFLYFDRKKRERKEDAPANQDPAAAQRGLWNQFLVGIGRRAPSPSTSAAVQATTPPGELPS